MSVSNAHPPPSIVATFTYSYDGGGKVAGSRGGAVLQVREVSHLPSPSVSTKWFQRRVENLDKEVCVVFAVLE